MAGRVSGEIAPILSFHGGEGVGKNCNNPVLSWREERNQFELEWMTVICGVSMVETTIMNDSIWFFPIILLQ
jgi:hypothetical protein